MIIAGELEGNIEGEPRRSNCSKPASVLATVKRDGIEAAGKTWTVEEEDAFKAPIRAQYESQGNPYYSTARLWDDGIIDPADTRRVLGLGISAPLNARIEPAMLGYSGCDPGGLPGG